jgi:hypothetical protein
MFRSPHWNHAEIHRRGEPPVQAYFLVTEVLPQGERRVIEKLEAERLFQLVGDFASEEDPGDVGLPDRDVPRSVRIGPGIAQSADERRPSRIAGRAAHRS